jgi:hypothetical protein
VNKELVNQNLAAGTRECHENIFRKRIEEKFRARPIMQPGCGLRPLPAAS